MQRTRKTGTTIRIPSITDFVKKDAAGNISCIECKSSATAPLAQNQRRAFLEIAKTGGTVVGKGKPGGPRGTQIPPKPVEIKRP